MIASEFYTIAALLIVFTALFGYVNHRFIKLPNTIGIMLISLICSLLFVVFGSLFPTISAQLISIAESIDFESLLMNVMLSFLLFAGATHVDAQKLKKEVIPIISFSTLGVLLSTIITGSLMFVIFRTFGTKIDLIYCFLFGALISPTDPIAVLGILKKSKIPTALETKITGESLFNDGIAVVIFLSIMEIATLGTGNLSVSQVGWLFIKEAVGGVLWGLLLGYAGFYLLKSIDNYQIEVLITLAMVMGGYTLASWLHVSGPLSMVVAGLITGNKGKKLAMSDTTKDYVSKFWELIDEILNAFLFLLIGFEILVINVNQSIIWISLIAIVVVLLARFVSVFVPIFFLSFLRTFEKNTIAILTWGGLRGGISVALALSLPANMYRKEFVAITYIIVLFSIIVQGLTLGKVADKLTKK